MKQSFVPTANAKGDLATFDDVLAFQLQEADVLEIVGKEKFAELHAERQRAHEAAGAPQGPRVIVRLKFPHGLNNANEICSLPAATADELVRSDRAVKLGVVED